jgi:solute carrier family 25 (mitochondrial citrate transporter), member 1
MDNKNESLAHLWIAGGIAGCCETAVTMPLEFAKTRQQIASASARVTMLSTFKEAIASNGIRGLYFGMPAVLVQTSGKVGIRFVAFEKFKSIMPCDANGRISKSSEFLAGCLAGATEAAIWITPCERLKVLRQAQIGVNNPLHASLLGSIALIMKEQGLRGLYRGLGATVARNGSSVGIRFALYSKGMSVMKELYGGSAWWMALVGGASVGAISTIINNPLDVVKSRMQADSQGKSSVTKYKNSLHCLGTVVREGGFSAMYRGVWARIGKVSSGQAIIFFAYERSLLLLREYLPS